MPATINLDSVIATVQEAIDQGVALPSWLDRLKDGKVSLQDRAAASKLYHTYYPKHAQRKNQRINAMSWDGTLNTTTRLEATVQQLSQEMRAAAKRQGFLSVLSETLKNLGAPAALPSKLPQV